MNAVNVWSHAFWVTNYKTFIKNLLAVCPKALKRKRKRRKREWELQCFLRDTQTQKKLISLEKKFVSSFNFFAQNQVALPLIPLAHISSLEINALDFNGNVLFFS